MTTVFDFTQRDITGREVLAAGAIGCMRYIANAPIVGANDKEIRKAEVEEKSAAGCRVGANFEWGERPTDSIATGQRHAGVFLQWCDDVGAPDWAPCYFSLDANNPAGAYHAYFTGIVREVGLSRSGVYGNGACYRSLLDAGLASLTWQSKSHSYAGNSASGPWPNTNLVQLLPTKRVGGHDVDVNTVLTPNWGGFLLGEDDPMALNNTDVATILHADGIIPNPAYRSDSPAHTPPGTNQFVAWQTLVLESAINASNAVAGLNALKAAVAKIPTTAVPSQPVDLDALAAKVADLLAARLKD